MSLPADESDRASSLARLARDLLDGLQDADDIAQDVWLLLERQPAGRVRSPPTWIGIAIRHTSVRWRRREQRRAERERLVARPDRVPSVLEQLERESQRELLTALVNGLQEPYREAVRLRYLEDRAIEEIAVELGRAPATVRSQIKRGLDQLRARLGVDPERRGKLTVFFPWLWRWRGSNAVAVRAALLLGVAAGALVVGLVAFSPRFARERLLASAPVTEEGPEVALADRIPPVVGARSVVAPEPRELATTEEPQQDFPPLAVEGDVLSSDGGPVAGAAIVVGREDERDSKVVAHSDGSGRYRIEAVDRRLLIWAELPESVHSRRHLLGSKRSEGDLDLQLGDPLGTLEGRVLSPDGRPVPNAVVSQRGRSRLYERTDQGTRALRSVETRSRTAADGTFRLGRTEEGGAALLVEAPGHPPFARNYARLLEGPEIVLTPPCALAGTLVRAGGAPVAGARLELVFPDPLPRRETTTDDGGAFRFETLPDGPYVLRVTEVVGASASCFEEGELVAGSEARRALTLRETDTIRGRLLDGDVPLAGWGVELDQRRRVAFPKEVRRVQTLDDGTFSFPSCSPVGYVIRLFEPGATKPCAVVRRVHAGEGEVVLRRADVTSRAGSLAGRLEAASPSLRPVIVALRSALYTEPLLVHVGPDGSFSASGLLPGRHKVLAWVPDVGAWLVDTIKIAPGQRTELHARVPEPGTLRVSIERPSGEPLDWRTLRATVATTGFHESNSAEVQYLRKCREESSFLIDLFPGEYKYLVSYRDAQYETRTARIESGETTADEVFLRDVVAVRLKLLLDRRLHKREKLFVIVRERSEERTIELTNLSRKTRSEKVRVSLARSVTELRVVSSGGLAGRLVPTEADLVDGAELRIELEEAERE